MDIYVMSGMFSEGSFIEDDGGWHALDALPVSERETPLTAGEAFHAADRSIPPSITERPVERLSFGGLRHLPGVVVDLETQRYRN